MVSSTDCVFQRAFADSPLPFSSLPLSPPLLVHRSTTSRDQANSTEEGRGGQEGGRRRQGRCEEGGQEVKGSRRQTDYSLANTRSCSSPRPPKVLVKSSSLSSPSLDYPSCQQSRRFPSPDFSPARRTAFADLSLPDSRGRLPMHIVCTSTSSTVTARIIIIPCTGVSSAQSLTTKRPRPACSALR